MRLLRYLFKGSLVILHLLLGLLLSALVVHPARWLGAEALRNAIVRLWFRALWRIFRLRVEISHPPAPAPFLLVANHIGWLDIIVLGGCLPVSFVAKAEIRRWPVIGWLCLAADTVFVERGSRDSAEHTTRALTHALQQGRSVAVFPEGTSTDGNEIKPFRRRLFRAALAAACPVQPVAILYPQAGRSHPAACYTGNDTMWGSFLRLLAEPSIEARVVFAEPVATVNLAGQEHADTALARQAEARVREIFLRAYPGSTPP